MSMLANKVSQPVPDTEELKKKQQAAEEYKASKNDDIKVPEIKGGESLPGATTPSFTPDTRNIKEKTVDAGKGVVNKTKNWFKGKQDKVGSGLEDYQDPYNQKQDVDYRPPYVKNENAENAENAIKATDDLIQRGSETGAKASKATQNVEVPRSKLSSFGDLFKSDEFKGQRIPYITNAVGTTLANALSGLSGREYDSYLKQHNQKMADTYAENKAARDTSAMKQNLEDLEAGNKAEMGKYVQLSDAQTEQALKRYGLLEDQETKRQVLNEIISQATNKTGDDAVWKNLNADEKFAVMALQQVYNGDYSVASMFLEKYGDDFMNIIDRLFNKLGLTNGNGEGGNDDPLTTGGNDNTPKVKLLNGQEVDAKEIEDNLDEYVAIPSRDGKGYVYFPKAKVIGGASKEEIDGFLQELVDNPKITPEMAYELEKEWSRGKLAFSHKEELQDKFDQKQKNLDEQFKAENAQKELEQTAGKYITNFLNGLKGSPEDIISKIQNDKKLNEYLKVAPLMQGQVNAKINQAQCDIADRALLGVTDNKGWNAAQKIENLETLTKNNADLLLKNPALKTRFDDALSQLYLDRDYIEPYTYQVDDYIKDKLDFEGQYGQNDITYKLYDNGSVNVNNGTTSKTYDFANHNFSKTSEEFANKMLTMVLDNGTIANASKLIDPEGNNTLKGVALVFKQTPIYKAMKNLVNNETLQKMANEKNWKKNPKYENLLLNYNSLKTAYDSWQEY